MLSKNRDETMKISVLKEIYARVTVRQKRRSVHYNSLKEISGFAQIEKEKRWAIFLIMGDKDEKASLIK